MKNFIQRGDVIDVTAGANIDSGDVVVLTDVVGVAQADIANGETGAVLVTGVVQLPCEADDVITVGAKLYWNGTALTLDPDDGEQEPTAYPFAGHATTAAGATVTTVQVKLWG